MSTLQILIARLNLLWLTGRISERKARRVAHILAMVDAGTAVRLMCVLERARV